MPLKNLIINGLISGATNSLVTNNLNKVLSHVNSKTIYAVNICSKNPYFEIILDWLEKERINGLRNVHYERRRTEDGVEFVETFGAGTYWVRLAGKHMLITLGSKGASAEQPKPSGPTSKWKPKSDRISSIKIQFLSLTPKADKEEFFRRMTRHHEKVKSKDERVEPTSIKIYKNNYWRWEYIGETKIRPFSSLIYCNKLVEGIINDLQNFYDKEEWYNKLNIPYQRGYLLYGAPGNGKTSLIQALAGHFQKKIFYFQYHDGQDDVKFAEFFEMVPHEDAIIVIEDIDGLLTKRNLYKNKDVETAADGTTAEEGRAKGTKDEMNLSGFLNCIDGILAPQGRVVIVTTNKIEALDAAVLRPGRLDYKIEIKNANKDQIARMADRFYPDMDPTMKKQFVDSVGEYKVSMAELQEFFTRNLYTENDILNIPEDWKV